MSSRKILGLWSGHDASFCVLNDGDVEMHTELERHLRVKEPAGDSIELFYQHHGDTSDLIGIATCHRDLGIKAHAESWEKLKTLGLPLHVVGHHQSHASNAFYSSNFEESLIVTVDGGGIEDENGFCVGGSIWHGHGTRLDLVEYFPLEACNIGGVWSRITRHVFKMEVGYPYGNQAGSTMSLAALAKDPHRFVPQMRETFSTHLIAATAPAPGHVRGMSSKDPCVTRHPYWGDLADMAQKDEQLSYDVAGALQIVTDEHLEALLQRALSARPGVKNVCFVGGVALNSLGMGRLAWKHPDINFYVPPVPYDAGLTIGAAQYVWHHTLGNPRVDWGNRGATSYLGKQYSREDVESALRERSSELEWKETTDDEVIDLLGKGNVVSVFNGRAESGRRALGNRSILGDPRRVDLREIVNTKIKSREFYRPVCPSVLYEHISEWFIDGHNCDASYMSFVLKIRPEKKALVPSILHLDDTARLQSVRLEQSSWYHGFLTRWNTKTGIPMLMNTSFNSRTPICEIPKHSVDCFLDTGLDYLYFPEYNILVSKL